MEIATSHRNGVHADALQVEALTGASARHSGRRRTLPSPSTGLGDLMVLQFGPQHPSTHGVLRIKLYLDGERIVKAVPMPATCSGVEKLFEELTYVQIAPIVDKNDYVSPMTNEQAVVMAFEALLKIEVPRRARWLRSALAEACSASPRTCSGSGTLCLDLGGALGGGSTTFLLCLRSASSSWTCSRSWRDHGFTITRIDRRKSARRAGGLGCRMQGRARTHPASSCRSIRGLTASNRIFLEPTRGVGHR